MIIAIDGACKGNGKPDCISSGCAFIKSNNCGTKVLNKIEESTDRVWSTNQRGELHGLLLGLSFGLNELKEKRDTLYLVTDSEYIYNAITKEWVDTWYKRGWVTAAGEPVKNQDLWLEAADLLYQFEEGTLVVFHVKGHLVSMGKATASNLIKRDPSLGELYDGVKFKLAVDKRNPKNQQSIADALVTFKKNHGYEPPLDKFYEMVVCNTVADVAASNYLANFLL